MSVAHSPSSVSRECEGPWADTNTGRVWFLTTAGCLIELSGNFIDPVEHVCNNMAKDGFEVFSVIVIDDDGDTHYRVTGRRDREATFTPPIV